MPPYKWKREEVQKMIEMVEERDSLWNVEQQHYHNQTIRRTALQEIEAALNIPVDDIKKKLHIMRAQYSKERSKMKTAKSGSGSKDTYKTKWEFFDLMQFMFRHRQKTTTVDSVVGETATSDIGGDDGDVNSDEQFSCAQEETQQSVNQSNEMPSIPVSEQLPTSAPTTLVRRPTSRKRKTPESSVELQEQAALNRCMAILSEVKPKDEFTIFGEYVANELRLLNKTPANQLKLKCQIQQLIVDTNIMNLSKQYNACSSSTQTSNISTSSLSSPSNTYTSEEQEPDWENSQELEINNFLKVSQTVSPQDFLPS